MAGQRINTVSSREIGSQTTFSEATFILPAHFFKTALQLLLLIGEWGLGVPAIAFDQS